MTYPLPFTVFAVRMVDGRMTEKCHSGAVQSSFGETTWREYESPAWYVAQLRKEGFSVEVGSGGMPTAFCAGGLMVTVRLLAFMPNTMATTGIVRRRMQNGHEGLGYSAGGHTDPHSGSVALAHFLQLRLLWKDTVSKVGYGILESRQKRRGSGSSMRPKC